MGCRNPVTFGATCHRCITDLIQNYLLPEFFFNFLEKLKKNLEKLMKSKEICEDVFKIREGENLFCEGEKLMCEGEMGDRV